MNPAVPQGRAKGDGRAGDGPRGPGQTRRLASVEAAAEASSRARQHGGRQSIRLCHRGAEADGRAGDGRRGPGQTCRGRGAGRVRGCHGTVSQARRRRGRRPSPQQLASWRRPRRRSAELAVAESGGQVRDWRWGSGLARVAEGKGRARGGRGGAVRALRQGGRRLSLRQPRRFQPSSPTRRATIGPQKRVGRQSNLRWPRRPRLNPPSRRRRSRPQLSWDRRPSSSTTRATTKPAALGRARRRRRRRSSPPRPRGRRPGPSRRGRGAPVKGPGPAAQ